MLPPSPSTSLPTLIPSFSGPRVSRELATAPGEPLFDPRSLRVVLLSDAVPGRNGVGTYYDDLADHLEEQVGQVRLICPPSDGQKDGDCFGFQNPGDPTQKIYLPSAARVWREVRAVAPDVIISATVGPYGFLGLVMAAVSRTACCVGYHTDWPKLAPFYWRDPLGRLSGGIARLWERLFFRLGSVAVAIDEDLMATAGKLGASQVRLVGTSIRRAFLEAPPKPLRDELRSVTYVGRLALEKNLEQVLEAVRAHPHLHFRVAGDGPLRPWVEAHAAERANLDYSGWITRGAVMRLLDDSDLLVLPSRVETFGIAALEAMARGRPALVSADCGITRWPDLVSGLLVMNGGEHLSSAIARVDALGPAHRKGVAERGRQAAGTLSQRAVQQWVEVLLDAVRMRKPA